MDPNSAQNSPVGNLTPTDTPPAQPVVIPPAMPDNSGQPASPSPAPASSDLPQPASDEPSPSVDQPAPTNTPPSMPVFSDPIPTPQVTLPDPAPAIPPASSDSIPAVTPPVTTPETQADMPSPAPSSDTTSPSDPAETPPVSAPSSTPADATTASSSPAGASETEAIPSEEREKLYKELADAMLEALDKGDIEVEDSEKSSTYILEHLDNVQTKDELKGFLKELGSRWPIYNAVGMGYITTDNDQNKIEDIQGQLTKLTTN